ncbi:hypothetical protein OKW76_04455 [Sphingomonas sp. S1-29]|uniref:hypothetical protein n=1 Tax=Sphingomonas sp. S1-29 TaxID=2991074 RepID=UPI002240558B|nr:hypothetical protein [Sphingomonas sp. S1-29]UZK70302.1 hypothetical protein OKW76_04455 [Sphingomonas sp. S1-29]
MSLQMYVLALKKTGHILAAVAQPAGGQPDVKALAGSDLPVLVPRANGSTATAVTTKVPAELLEVKALVYDPVVIAHPLSYVVDGSRVAALPSLGAAAASVLTATTVTVNAAVGQIPVAVVITGKDDPDLRRAEEGDVPATGTQVALVHTILPNKPPANLPTGQDYYLLIAEGGRRVRLEKASL